MGLFGLHLPKKVDDIFSGIGHVATGVERQINPLDNGVTYSRPVSSGPAPASLASQGYNSFVKPLISTAELPLKVGALAGNELVWGRNSDQTGNAAASLANTYKNSMLNQVVSPFFNLGKGLANVPQAGYRELQNWKPVHIGNVPVGIFPQGKPVTDIQQRAFGTTNQGDIAKSIVGNTAAAMLTVGAPELTGGASELASPTIESIANPVARQLAQTGVKTAAAATVGFPFGVAQTYGSDPEASLSQAIQGGKQGAASFGILAAAPGLAKTVKVGAENSLPLNEIGSVGRDVNTPSTVAPNRVKVTKAGNVSAKSGPTKLDAITGMHDILNAGGTVDEAMGHYMKARNASYGEAQLEIQKLFNGSSLDKGSVNASLNPEYDKVPLGTVKAGDTVQPILNARTVSTEAIKRGNAALELVNKLSDKDHALLDNLRSTSVDKLVKQADRPTAFRKAAEAIKNYNDFTHAAGVKAGQDIPYRQNYGAPLYFDQSSPEAIAAMDKAHKAALATDPGYAQRRSFKDYNDAAQYGLKRANANFAADLTKDIQNRSNHLRQLTLANGLNDAFPGQVKVGEIGVTPEGVYKQLQIAGGNKLSLPAEIADKINARATTPTSRAGALYDKAARGGKQLAVGGNPFHAITEGFRFAGQQLLSPEAWKNPGQTLAGHVKVVAGTFSEKAADAARRGYEADGTNKWAQLGGATLERNQIAGDVATKWYDTVSKANPIRAIHEAVFGREIPLQKLEIIKQAMEGSTDYSNPELLAKARAVSLAANHMFGGLDRATDGFTPRTARWLGRFSFSADYTEAKGRLIQDALTKSGPQGNIARQAVIGKALLTAAPGIIAASAAGNINWHDPKDVAKKIALQIIDPSLPTPYKTASGISKVAKLPASDVAEIARVIEPFFNGDPNKLSGAEHWATARVNPIIAPVVKLATNQDYKGDPVIAHKTDAQGNDLGINIPGTLENLGGSSLTSPGTNLFKVARGEQSIGEAGINAAGLRTAADTSDPRMQSMSYAQNLIKSQPKQIQADYAATHPKRIDANGIVVQDRSFLDSASKAAAFLANPKLLALDQQIADKNKALGLPVDPFYNLPTDQQKVVLNLTNDRGFNAGDPVIKRQTADNPWLSDFYKQRSQYYASQNIKPDTTNPVDIPAPVADASTQGLLNKLNGLSSGDAAKLIQNNPNLSSFLAKTDQYNRDKRTALGKPQYDQYPQAPAGVQKTLDTYNTLPQGTGARSAWIQAHPNEYAAMTKYLTQASIYSLQTAAGQAAFQSQGFSQQGLKDIKNIGQYDIATTKDANGNTLYSLAPGQGSGSSFGGYNNYSKINPASYIKKYGLKSGNFKSAPRASIGKVSVKPRSKRSGKVVVKSSKIRLA